jgi:DNA-binding NarL/FixJ family response regulator
MHVGIMASERSRRDWLERELRAERSLTIVGVAPTFPLLRSLLYDTVVDAVVVDVPSASDSEVVRDWLTDLLNAVPVVMLCGADDSWFSSQVIRAERGAVLSRESSAAQIAHAVRGVTAGLLVFDATLMPRPEVSGDIAAELTPREIQVLRLLAEGLVNREIAERLNISEHTIKFHIGSILGKLQASSRTEAVTRGLRAGLIEL